MISGVYFITILIKLIEGYTFNIKNFNIKLLIFLGILRAVLIRRRMFVH